MSDTQVIEVRQVVAAPVERVFTFLADPRTHVAIDGSGTVKAAGSEPITRVGQEFFVDMHRDDLGHYRTRNTVTEYEPDQALGWAPGLDLTHACPLVEMVTGSGMTTGGHTYTYRLRAVDGGTEVRQVYDWSGVEDPQFAAFCPFVSREELAETLTNLARAVERTP